MSIYLALLLDYLLGDPKWLPHPVVAVGKLIAFYEKLLYPRQYGQSAFRQGCLLVLATLALGRLCIRGFIRLAGRVLRRKEVGA